MRFYCVTCQGCVDLLLMLIVEAFGSPGRHLEVFFLGTQPNKIQQRLHHCPSFTTAFGGSIVGWFNCFGH
jgi:hypothetical protein